MLIKFIFKNTIDTGLFSCNFDELTYTVAVAISHVVFYVYSLSVHIKKDGTHIVI